MKSKAAIQVEHGGPLVVEEIDIPDPGPDQVTVRNFASGVCYSQVHQLRDPGLPRPMGLGHEGSGVVTRVGKDVTHVKEGDHVISTWVPRTPISGLPVSRPTGAAFDGRPVIADGDVYTWSEHMVTFADKVVPMSPSDPTDITCLVGCAVLTGAGAVLHTANVGRGQSVAVFGVGGVGLSAIGAAAVAGADPVIAVDLADRKLQFAREFGATHGINALNTDPVEAISEIRPGGVDVAMDAVGAPVTALQILRAVRQGGPRADNQGGTAVLLGIPVSDVSVDLNELLLYQRHYCGSLGATDPEADFPLFLGWVREGRFPLAKLVTDRFPLDRIDEACVALEEGRILGRAIVEM
ncbi:oxidoreductase [Streptomyces spiralis]|uniref:Oxidoreductase n=1 Tax=Streptomyces spiralis TaxID=66376 RepID=A0A919DS60_9ACTN|nr:zinc-binding dehydrogenase [Streptomyces spiralis]GHE74611.1 oxidoreductase [Streptomyces spiralis]